MAHALIELDRLDSDELARAALEFEYEDLYARFKNPHLRPLVARTYAALVASFELTTQQWLENADIAGDQLLEEGSVSIDTLDAPARLRRYLRQVFRGKGMANSVCAARGGPPLSRASAPGAQPEHLGRMSLLPRSRAS